MMEACFAESGDPDEVAALRAECALLRVRDGELRTACGRLERRVNRLSEEQDWAARRIARLTERCTHLAGLVPVAALATLTTENAPHAQTASDDERSPVIVSTAGDVPAPGGVSPADDVPAPDGVRAAGEPASGGLVAALAGDGGARLAAAVQTAVGDLAALSVPDPDAAVEDFDNRGRHSGINQLSDEFVRDAVVAVKKLHMIVDVDPWPFAVCVFVRDRG